MAVDKSAALKHLDEVIRQYDDISRYAHGILDAEETSLVMTRSRACVVRLAPPGSVYAAQATRVTNEYQLIGVVKALRDDYASDCMQSFHELLNADLFSDFLGMAEYLLQDESLKQPAAVLAGGVLEEHLRKLCDKHNIPTTSTDSQGKVRPKKADAMNNELRKSNVYGQNDQKQVTAWLGIRNSAAHAKYDEFDETQVSNMTSGLRAFISRFPA